MGECKVGELKLSETGYNSTITYFNGTSSTGNWWDYSQPWQQPNLPPTFYQPYPKQFTAEELKEICEKLLKENKKNEEVDIMYLYRVYLIYAADRKNPVVVTTGSTIAKDDDDAKVKSGVYQKILPEWDADYVTIITEKVAEVKVKPKPQEVKTV